MDQWCHRGSGSEGYPLILSLVLFGTICWCDSSAILLNMQIKQGRYSAPYAKSAMVLFGSICRLDRGSILLDMLVEQLCYKARYAGWKGAQLGNMPVSAMA